MSRFQSSGRAAYPRQVPSHGNVGSRRGGGSITSAGSEPDRGAMPGFDSCHHTGVLFGLLVMRAVWFTCYERLGGLWPFRSLRCSCATLSDGCLSPSLPRMGRISVGKQQRSLSHTRGSTGIGCPRCRILLDTSIGSVSLGCDGIADRGPGSPRTHRPTGNRGSSQGSPPLWQPCRSVSDWRSCWLRGSDGRRTKSRS